MKKFLFGGVSVLSLVVATNASASYVCEPESYVYQECDEGKYLVDGQCVGCPTDRIATEVWAGYTGPDSVVDGWDNVSGIPDGWLGTRRDQKRIGCRFSIPLDALNVDNGGYKARKPIDQSESLFCGLVENQNAADYTGVEIGHYVCFTTGGNNFYCNNGYQLSGTCFGDSVSGCNVHASADTADVWIVRSLDALSCKHVGDTYYSTNGQLLATQCPAIDAYEVTETDEAITKTATTIYGVTSGTEAATITDCHLPTDRPNIWYYTEGVGYYSVEGADCMFEEETAVTE